MTEISELIKEKSIIYLNGIEELKGQEPNDMLIDFVIEKYKQHRNFPSSFSNNRIEEDLRQHITTLAMAVVDLYAKVGAEGQTSHNENSIGRAYENAYVSNSIFNDVLPYVNIL